MKLLQSLPLTHFLKNYRTETLVRDCVAGIAVSVVMIPQCMGYALLAGMPAEYGLYCAILPSFLYALLGSSRCLSVGPAALISIIVASSIAALKPQTDAQAVYYAVNLTFLAGVFLLAMRLLRLGNLTNYISTPVISGFTSAAALTIMLSQLKHMLGVDIAAGLGFGETLLALMRSLVEVNGTTLSIGVGACLVLWYFKSFFPALIKTFNLPAWLEQMLGKSGPMVVVFGAVALVAALQLDQTARVAVLGEIPAGLPDLTAVWSGFSLDIELWKQLALPAFLIALMCFITSIAVGSSLASLRKERVNANQELLALGVANLGAAMSGTFALAGSLSRSAVNHQAGAETPVASVISALCIILTLVVLTPLFYFLPLAVLGAIVIMSVFSMIDVAQVRRCWKLNREDAYSLLATFFAVLLFDIEIGICVGIILSIVLLVHRASHPHIAVVGRVGESAHFRNIERHDVVTDETIVAIRVDESIYFSNVQYIEGFILEQCSAHPQAQHVVLICSSVSFIDATAVDALEQLGDKLRETGITLHLAEVKGPVMDQLKKTEMIDRLKPGRIFFTVDEAMRQLAALKHDA